MSFFLDKIKEHFDAGSLAVIAVTFLLFAIALFVKGFTHDLLLEAGVFLVSLKLIMMGYRNSQTNKRVLQELRDIKDALNKLPKR